MNIFKKLLFLTVLLSFSLESKLVNLDKSDKKITLENFLIGRGSYKNVYRSKFDGFDVAAICFSEDKRGLSGFEREIKFYKKYKHKNIIKAYAYSKKNRMIILELAECDLYKYFYKKDVSLKNVIDIFINISSGLSYLHENNIIHRDIKPENIVLVKDGTNLIPKIIDFDTVVEFNDRQSFFQESAIVGTLYYRAPELFKPAKVKYYNGEFSSIFTYFVETDIYALGVLFYNLLNNSSFYHDLFKSYSEKFMNISGRDKKAFYFSLNNKSKINPKKYNLFKKTVKFRKSIEKKIFSFDQEYSELLSSIFNDLTFNEFFYDDSDIGHKDSFICMLNGLIYTMVYFDFELRPDLNIVLTELIDIQKRSDEI